MADIPERKVLSDLSSGEKTLLRKRLCLLEKVIEAEAHERILLLFEKVRSLYLTLIAM